MADASKVALAVTSGYLLGRTKKLKMAITVGSMIAGKKIATDPKELLDQGRKLVEGNEELRKLSEQISGKLFDAARAAAIAAATSRLERFSDSIHNRTEAMKALTESGVISQDEAEELTDELLGGEEGQEDQAQEGQAEEPDEGAEEDYEEAPEEGAAQGEEATGDEEAVSDEEQEPEEPEQEEPEQEEQPPPAKKTARKSTGTAKKAAPQGGSTAKKAASQGSSTAKKAASQGSATAEKAASGGSSTAKKTASKGTAPAKKGTAPAKKAASKGAAPAKKTAKRATKKTASNTSQGS